MVRVLFLPAARLDVIEARDWYAARGAGLGEAFVAEIDRQVLRIADAPSLAPVILADARRILTRRFPYALFYRVVDGDAFVLACFHASRAPKRWQERLGE
jgi:plasmid stabilization system protein ParE